MRPAAPLSNSPHSRFAAGARCASALLLLALPAGAARAESAVGDDAIWGDARNQLVKGRDGYRLLTGASAGIELEVPAAVRLEALYSLARTSLVGGIRSGSQQDGSAGELYLALADAAGLHELPAPPGRAAGATRENGVALASARGELAGVAFLEADAAGRSAVEVARWNGMAFDAPQEISAAGPGSQVALTGAALDDGSTLLLWARYDGADDEIYWAKSEGGRWSTAAAIAADNAVPDIVPAVIAVPGGALAAWSRYDGHDYRLVLARYSGGRWSEPREIGEPGSVYPSFERSASGARLLHESARPHGWTVVDLAADGRELRRATLATPSPSRPLLLGERLRWAGSESVLRWGTARSGGTGRASRP